MKKVIIVFFFVLFLTSCKINNEIKFDISEATIEASSVNLDWGTKAVSISDQELTFEEVSDNIDYNTPGTYNVTIKAINRKDNTKEITFDVTVVDTTPPSFNIDNQEINVFEYTSLESLITDISDNSDTHLTYSEHNTSIDYNVHGEYSVDIRLTDEYGNYTEQTITVYVIDPLVLIDFDISSYTIEAGTSDIDWNMFVIQGTNTDVTYEEIQDGIDYDTPGIYQVTVKATDVENYTLNKTFNITVVDTIPPAFNIENQEISVFEYSSMESFITDITDNSDTEITYSEQNTSIDYNVYGEYSVDIRLTDESGNYTEKTIIVKVNETLLNLLSNSSFEIETVSKIVYDLVYSYYDVDLDGLYTITSSEGEIGIIYQVGDENNLELLFQRSCDQSFSVNDIVFVYKIDNYVLELKHKPDSTFPETLEVFTIDTNYQYDYFYTDSLELHPLIQYLRDRSYEYEELTQEFIIEHKTAYTTTDVSIVSVKHLLSDTFGSILVMEFNNIEDANIVFYDQVNCIIPQNANTVVIQYQNIVLRIEITVGYEDNIFDNLPDGLEYITYDQFDIDYTNL